MEPKDLARICGPGNKKSGREAAAFQPYLFPRERIMQKRAMVKGKY
jgi:hypothetical protein